MRMIFLFSSKSSALNASQIVIFSSIQPNIITQIGEVISHLKSQQTMAIVLVEQYFDFAFGLADQIYAMMRGEIVYEGQKTKISKAKLRKSVGV